MKIVATGSKNHTFFGYSPQVITVPKFCSLLFFAYLFALAPLLLSGVLFQDDLIRAQWGASGWSNWSRYLSDALSGIIHGSSYLSDVGPLTQFIAIACLVSASAVVITALRGSYQFYFWDIPAALLFGLSPYFLQCLSYRYDAPYMALSVLLAVAPLAFKGKKRLYPFAVFASSICMCATYQASSGLFPMSVVMIALLEWVARGDWRSSMRFMLVSAFAYCLALFVFKVAFVAPQDYGYASTNVEMSIVGIATNWLRYWRQVIVDLPKGWNILVIALTLLFVGECFSTARKSGLVAVALSLLAIAFMGLSAFGVYPLLNPISLAPRAMYGASFYSMLLAMGIVTLFSPDFQQISREASRNWGQIYGAVIRSSALSIICLLCWLFVSFSAVYGNALSQQDEWESFRIQEVVDDLTDLTEFESQGTKLIQIAGTAGYAPQIRNRTTDSDLLKRLVYANVGEGGWLLKTMILERTGLSEEGVSLAEQDSVIADWQSLPVLQESSFHRIFSTGNHFIIEFK